MHSAARATGPIPGVPAIGQARNPALPSWMAAKSRSGDRGCATPQDGSRCHLLTKGQPTILSPRLIRRRPASDGDHAGDLHCTRGTGMLRCPVLRCGHPRGVVRYLSFSHPPPSQTPRVLTITETSPTTAHGG
jgi:hypothetical protein